MTGLFRSNIRKEIFSKTGKKVISQQTCKEPYIYDVHMEVGCPHGMRGYKFCHVSVDGVVTKLVIFCGCQKCMTPRWFKITTNSITRGSSFFFNIKSQSRYIMSVQKTFLSPPAPLPTHSFPHSTDDQRKEHATFSWYLLFYVNMFWTSNHSQLLGWLAESVTDDFR